MSSSRRFGLAAVITACVLWGASFYFGKIALGDLPADKVVLWRFLLALAVLVPLVGSRVLRSRSMQRTRSGRHAPLRPSTELRRWPSRGDWPLFILNAVLMVPAQFVLQFEGLARTTASSAALIVGGFAPMLAVAAALFAHERLGGLGWGAVVCSTIGLVVMVGAPGEGRTLEGDLMVLGSLVAAVCMVLTTQRLVRSYDSLVVTVAGMGIGTLILMPWSWASTGGLDFDVSARVWGALFGLGIGCTAVTFSLWNWGLRHIPASRAGVYVNIEPVIGAILGIVLLGDVVSWEVIVGGALVLSSAVIISWPTSAPFDGEDSSGLGDGNGLRPVHVAPQEYPS